MKKLDSIELLHANGDSTVIDKEVILELVVEEVTETLMLEDDFKMEKSYACEAFHLEIIYNDKDEDKEVVERLLEQRDLEGFILHYKKEGKQKEFELPYLEESKENLNNIFEMAVEFDMKEITDDVVEDGDKLLAIDIAYENIEFEEEGVD